MRWSTYWWRILLIIEEILFIVEVMEWVLYSIWLKIFWRRLNGILLLLILVQLVRLPTLDIGATSRVTLFLHYHIFRLSIKIYKRLLAWLLLRSLM
jgi:hypothetical protein